MRRRDRGQLSESQLANSITHPNIVEFEKRRARERSDANLKRGDAPSAPVGAVGESEGRVSEKLAEKAGVGRRSVERALIILWGG